MPLARSLEELGFSEHFGIFCDIMSKMKVIATRSSKNGSFMEIVLRIIARVWNGAAKASGASTTSQLGAPDFLFDRVQVYSFVSAKRSDGFLHVGQTKSLINARSPVHGFEVENSDA